MRLNGVPTGKREAEAGSGAERDRREAFVEGVHFRLQGAGWGTGPARARVHAPARRAVATTGRGPGR
jgi:hypothetical protein